VKLDKENKKNPLKGSPDEIISLFSRLKRPLPGLSSQLKAAPPYRDLSFELSLLSKARKASVLWLMYPSEEGRVEGVLIERSEYNGVHSKQIAMPGGERDDCDMDDLATALRECEEELGVKVGRNNVIGALTPLYIPTSKFFVRPFVAWLPVKPVWSPDSKEVASVLSCEMSYISNKKNWGKFMVMGNQVPGFMLNNNLVWGATAMILSELVECWSVEA